MKAEIGATSGPETSAHLSSPREAAKPGRGDARVCVRSGTLHGPGC